MFALCAAGGQRAGQAATLFQCVRSLARVLHVLSFDGDDSGFLEPPEVQRLAVSLLRLQTDGADSKAPTRPSVDQSTLNKLFEKLMKLDTNGDGKISKERYCMLVNACCRLRGVRSWAERRNRAVRVFYSDEQCAGTWRRWSAAVGPC